MEHQFWHSRWQSLQIGFHQTTVNAHLQAHWPALQVEPGARVLVPLCGKSGDMRWLHAQGHPVVGVELSGIACEAFFAEQGLTAERTQVGDYGVWRGTGDATGLTLLEGDFFAAPAELVGEVHALYDRASLIALPPAMRPQHAAQLSRLLPAGAPGLIITIAYPQHEKNGPPFSVPTDDVAALLGGDFEVSVVDDVDALSAPGAANRWGLSSLHELVHGVRRT